MTDKLCGLLTFFLFQCKHMVSIKCKDFPYMPWRHRVGAELYFRLFLTSAVDGGEWSTSRSSRFTLRREPLYPLKGRLGGSVWTFWRCEILWQDLNSSLFHSVAYLLYRQRYPSPLYCVSTKKMPFRHVRRVVKSDRQLHYVRPSFCSHETTRLPLDGFSWNLIFECF